MKKRVGDLTWMDRAKGLFRRAFLRDGSPDLMLTILGTDVRQVTKAHDLSFGMLLEGGDETVVLDPGPDIDQQLWRHGPGPKMVKSVLVTHHNHLVRAGVGRLKAMGVTSPVHAERLNTLSPLTKAVDNPHHMAICGCKVKALRVKHEAGEESCAYLIEGGGMTILVAPHVKTLAGLPKPDVLILGIDDEGNDPEYVSLKDVVDFDVETFLAAYVTGTFRSEKADQLPSNVTALQRGDRLAFSAGKVKVLREPEEDLVVAKGWVSMSEQEGKPTIHVAGDPSEVLQTKLAGLVGPELREEVEFSYGGEAPEGSVVLFDLCLKGAAPKVIKGGGCGGGT